VSGKFRSIERGERRSILLSGTASKLRALQTLREKLALGGLFSLMLARDRDSLDFNHLTRTDDRSSRHPQVLQRHVCLIGL
jgi:hypothetical protein